MVPILRTVAAWLYTGIYLPVFAATYLLCLRRWPASWVQRTIRFWGRSTLAILGIRLELVNASTLETREPRIFICNHQSALDILWGAAICPPAPLAIGKKEVIWIPFLNVVWWALDFIRLDRSRPERAIATLRRAADMIRSGSRSLLIAPEGTRSPTGQLLPFKKGAFHLSLQSGAPIYPVAMSGAYALMPKQSFVAKPGVIRLRFLDPVSPGGVTPEKLDAWIEQIRGRVLEASRGLELPASGS